MKVVQFVREHNFVNWHVLRFSLEKGEIHIQLCQLPKSPFQLPIMAQLKLKILFNNFQIFQCKSCSSFPGTHFILLVAFQILSANSSKTWSKLWTLFLPKPRKS